MDNSTDKPALKTPITQEQFNTIIDLVSDGMGVFNACASVKCSTKSYYKYKDTVDGAGKCHMRAKQCRTEFLLAQIDKNNALCIEELRECEPMRCSSIQRHYDSVNKGLFEYVKRLNAEEYGDKIDVTSNGQSLVREISIIPANVSINPMSTETIDNDKT